MYNQREKLDEYLTEFIEGMRIDINAAKEGNDSEMMDNSRGTEIMFESWREVDDIRG